MKHEPVQSSGCLLLRVWQEVCRLFLKYLNNSASSPQKKDVSIFHDMSTKRT